MVGMCEMCEKVLEKHGLGGCVHCWRMMGVLDTVCIVLLVLFTR
jgi:hypothetical protein